MHARFTPRRSEGGKEPYRDVEDLLAERGVDVSYETVRRWVLKFGVLFARELRKRHARPSAQWHLDELVVVIGWPALLSLARRRHCHVKQVEAVLRATDER
jgi:hypothetical protein